MTIDAPTQFRLIINHLLEIKTDMKKMENRIILIEKGLSNQRIAITIYGTFIAAVVAAIISSIF